MSLPTMTLRLLGLLLVLTASPIHALPHPAAAGFTPNLGQYDPQVAYQIERGGVQLFVTTRGELVHRLVGADGRPWVLVERLHQAQPLAPATAEADTARIAHIDADGTRSAPTARRIDLGEAWPGIRVDLQLADDGVEKRFHLAPGADANAIMVALDGIDGLRLAEDGRLLLDTGPGPVELSAPIAWQDIGGTRRPVPVAFKQSGPHRYGFMLGPHDPAHGVTIDPILRATFVGGAGGETVSDLVVADDSIYVAGMTNSTDFPGTQGGYQPSPLSAFGGWQGTFLARYSLDLTVLMQATYFGSFGNGPAQAAPQVTRIAVSNDSVYATGQIPGNAALPGATGGLQPAGSGAAFRDVFVARFSRDLTQLHQSTYFGGTTMEFGSRIAVGPDSVYVAGTVYVITAAGSGTPVTSVNLPGLAEGAWNSLPVTGTHAVYLARMSLDLTSSLATTWVSLGGGTPQSGVTQTVLEGLVIGDDGTVHVSGYDQGHATYTPVVYSRALLATEGAFKPTRTTPNTAGATESFIVHLAADLKTIHRSTYTGKVTITGMALGEGNLYAAGLFQGPGNASHGFPIPDPENSAQPDARGVSILVLAFDPDLSTLRHGTFYSHLTQPSRIDASGGLAVRNGNIYVAGGTSGIALPATSGGAEPENQYNPCTQTNCGGCGYALRLNPALSEFRQATYIGCQAQRYITGLAVNDDTLYLAGYTPAATLPASEGSAQPQNGGFTDGFIVALTNDLGDDVKPIADLAVEKTGSELRIENRYLRYTVNVTNLGPDAAEDARIQDLLPPELGATHWTCSASGGAQCPQTSGTGSIDMTTTLPDGGTLTYELCSVVVGGSALVVNTAQATVANHTLDPVSANNHASASTFDPSLFRDGFEQREIPALCPP